MERVYPQLIGTYHYVKSISDKGEFRKATSDTLFVVEINKKDFMVFTKNKKKIEKLKIQETTLPFLDDQNHLVVGKNNEFEPVFFHGDTLLIQSFPSPFSENCFVKN